MKILIDLKTMVMVLTIYCYLGWILQQMISLHYSTFEDSVQDLKTRCSGHF